MTRLAGESAALGIDPAAVIVSGDPSVLLVARAVARAAAEARERLDDNLAARIIDRLAEATGAAHAR